MCVAGGSALSNIVLGHTLSPITLEPFFVFLVGWKVTGDPAEVLWDLSLVMGPSSLQYRNGRMEEQERSQERVVVSCCLRCI